MIHSRQTKDNRQAGFSLVTAVFLLVILSALGAFMVNISTVQQSAFAIDVLSARGVQAARSGIDWGAYQVLQSASCAASTTVPMSGTLADFTTVVTCTSTAHSEVASTITMYELTSTATRGTATNNDYVSRQMKASIAR